MLDRLPTIRPMLAKPGDLPERPELYGFEFKWDGFRAITYCADGELRIASRNDYDYTPFLPELHRLAGAVRRPVILDGELVVLNAQGKPDFEMLQEKIGVRKVRRAELLAIMYVFDVLQVEDEPLLGLPYAERRARLEHLVLGARWIVPPYEPGRGADMLAVSKEHGLEGVIAKRLDSRYEPGRRSGAWIKIKNNLRQEVVIGGWLRGAPIGPLLVGVHDERGLRYVGRVVLGLERWLDTLAPLLKPRASASSPFYDRAAMKDATWCRPEIVAEVEFQEWTTAGKLRHAVMRGLRPDRDPRSVVRET